MNTMTETAITTTAPAALAETIRAAIEASTAPATRRAYSGAWKRFADWTDANAAAALPAAPETVAAYLAARALDGVGIASLRMDCAAIGAAHKAAGAPNPAAAPLVKTALQGFSRQAADAGQVQRQARPLTSEAVAAIRGSLNGRADSSRYHALTMALCSVLSDAGLRRSEAAALTWADVQTETDGSARLAIRRSKTDQAGDGAVVAITAAAAADLERLRGLTADAGTSPTAPVFGLSARQIARRVAAAAAAAGLGQGYSGHSGRVGLAVRMVRNGAPSAAVMRQGRWASTRMVGRYTRNETAGEALRYL